MGEKVFEYWGLLFREKVLDLNDNLFPFNQWTWALLPAWLMPSYFCLASLLGLKLGNNTEEKLGIEYTTAGRDLYRLDLVLIALIRFQLLVLLNGHLYFLIFIIGLHSFIAVLCTYFVHRVHLERYNTKWKSKTQGIDPNTFWLSTSMSVYHDLCRFS